MVPPTLLSAFQLPQSSLAYAHAICFSCYRTGLLRSGVLRSSSRYYGRARWPVVGTILTITLGEASRGHRSTISLPAWRWDCSLGVLTMLIGFSGLGHRLARLFTPSVMVLFMLMLGAQLTTIFSKVCSGCRLRIADPNFKIQLPPFALLGGGDVTRYWR
ncbi:hypothetical protein OIU92_09605 [Escherichia coli]|nr:hypothetical protein [Escherichia coli]